MIRGTRVDLIIIDDVIVELTYLILEMFGGDGWRTAAPGADLGVVRFARSKGRQSGSARESGENAPWFYFTTRPSTDWGMSDDQRKFWFHHPTRGLEAGAAFLALGRARGWTLGVQAEEVLRVFLDLREAFK